MLALSNRLASQKGPPVTKWVATVMLLASPALGGPLSPGDFGPNSRRISFDQFAHGTQLSSQFQCSDGVILGSTTQIGEESSPDTADWQQPGEQISPFLFAIEAVPAAGTSSPPMKVIAGKYS